MLELCSSWTNLQQVIVLRPLEQSADKAVFEYSEFSEETKESLRRILAQRETQVDTNEDEPRAADVPQPTIIAVRAVELFDLINDVREMAKPRADWHSEHIVMASEVIRTLIMDIETVAHRLAHLGGFDDAEHAVHYLRDIRF